MTRTLVSVSGGATFSRFELIKAASSFAAVGAFNVFTTDVTLQTTAKYPKASRQCVYPQTSSPFWESRRGPAAALFQPRNPMVPVQH
jgi:hypothetical protein